VAVGLVVADSRYQVVHEFRCHRCYLAFLSLRLVCSSVLAAMLRWALRAFGFFNTIEAFPFGVCSWRSLTRSSCALALAGA